MTKEERAEKWFRKIANSEAISMEKKMEICNKVAKKMVILFIVIFLLEFVLLFMINDGVIFNHLSDFLNRLNEGKHTRNHYKGIALVGTLLCLPIMVLPIIVTLIFKKTWMKAEVYKVIDKIKRDKTFSPNNEPVSCMNEWMGKWEGIKENLDCQIDLDSYFTKKQIGRGILNILDIGTVYFPTGRIFACDPMIELEDAKPYIQTVPIGTHPVKICVVSEEVSGDRYACVKVEINKNKVMRYELAMVGNENLDEEMEKGDYFGFGVDCGMACIADVKTQEAFKKYWKQREREEEGIDPYNDLFDNLLEENFKTNPKYQRECGDWLNWRIPETEYNIPIFASGWGDGYYPCYFGYDVQGKISAVYIHFIDIQADYID